MRVYVQKRAGLATSLAKKFVRVSAGWGTMGPRDGQIECKPTRRPQVMQVRARRQVAAAALVATALVTAGCGGGAASNPVPAPTAVTVAPPPTTQAGTAAQQAALTAAITRYQAVYDSVYNNPRQDLAIVNTVAAGEEALSLRDQAKQVAQQKLVSTGSIKLVRLRVDSVTPSPVAGGPTTANVTTCNDVSATTVVDTSGKSVVDPHRLPQTKTTFRLQNLTPKNPAGWRVIQGRSGPTIPCDPA